MSLSNRFSYPESEEKVITIRQPKTALLLIDSADRFPFDKFGVYDGNAENGTYNNYRINHQKLNGFGQVRRVGVSEVLFPWITPNVNPRTNLFVIAGLSGLAPPAPPIIAYYVLASEGFYTAQSICDPVGAPGTGPLAFQLNNNLKFVSTNDSATYGAGTWTVSYNSNSAILGNGTITIANTNPAITFKVCTVPNGQGTINGTRGLDTLIGLGAQTFENITVEDLGNTETGAYANMTYTTYIDICSNALCKFQKLRDSLTQFTYSNIICRIYLASPTNMSPDPFGVSPVPSFLTQYQNIKWMEWNADQMIGEIDIQYFDDSGEPLYIPDNSQDISQLITVIMSDT